MDSPEAAPGGVSPLAPKPTEVRAGSGLDHSLVHSLAWRAIGNWSSQILTWASFLIVARLLSPSDFGIVSMAVVLYSYLRWVGEFGIPQTVVTLRHLTEEQIVQLNSIAVLLGIVCFGLSCGLAYPVAMFFKTPRLFPVVVTTCSVLVALGFRAVPEGLLYKDLRFRWLSVVDGACDVLAAIVTLFMAWRGEAYWALVMGNLLAGIARSALMVHAKPLRLVWPRISSVAKELLFGWRVLVSTLAYSSYERLDNITAGRVLGPAALGFYGMAWNLANVPLEKVTTLVVTVVPTYLAAVQSDVAALRRYLRGITEVLALATFPATIGLALVAREFITVLLGAKWLPMVPALQVLCVYAAFRSLVSLLDKVLTVAGKPRFVMWTQLWALLVLPAAFYAGSHWGIRGIAWGWVAAYPLVALPLYWETFRTVDLPVGEYLRSIWPALSASLVMIAAVSAAERLLPSGLVPAVRLVLAVGIGGVAYVGTLFALHRERALTLINMVRAARQGKRGQPSPAS